MLSTKQTLVGVGVTSAPIVGEPLITAEYLMDLGFMGITIGGWLYILSFFSILLLIFLNGFKAVKLIKSVINKLGCLEDKV